MSKTDTRSQPVAPSALAQTIKDDELLTITGDPLLSTVSDQAMDTDTVDAQSNAGKVKEPPPNIAQTAAFKSQNGKDRYRIVNLLGSGGGGSVYNAHDHNLHRKIAIKVTPSSKIHDDLFTEKVIREASLTSKLEHQNIPPIYDIDLCHDGRIYYSMKKIDGKPLSAYISTDKNTQEPALSHQEIASVFLKICLASSYAHHHGIIHRDIKPDNIMIGEHGEVYLVDWGIAIHREDTAQHKNKMAGTPIYMSPEQARKEPATEQSDIYCIGASLYHVLFNIHPATFDDTDTFWDHKKRGIIPEIPADNSNTVPADFSAICLKCLKTNPQERYSSLEDLIDDLKSFQFGKMVSAYNYSLLEGLKFHLKSSSKHFIWVGIIIVFLAIASTQILKYLSLEFSGWGQAVYQNNFDDADSPNTLDQDWVVFSKSGHLAVENKKLSTKEGHEFTWFYNKPFSGGVAIEFEGRIPANSTPGDLSIVYCPDIHDIERSLPKNIYYLQHGAVDNSCSIIEGPDGRVAFNPIQLEQNTVYKIRGEIDSEKLRLYLDGRLICSYDLLFPIKKGYIGFYSYYHGKEFDNIKIFNKTLPQLTGIISTGDVFYDKGQYELALERYEHITKNHHGSKTGNESLYKAGLCHLQLGNTDAAFESWQHITNNDFQNHINHYRWKDLYSKRNFDTLIEDISDTYLSSPNNQQIKNEWARYLRLSTKDGELVGVKKLLSIRNQLFPTDQVYSLQVLNALRLSGDTNRALVLFPEQEHIAIRALLEAGRYADIRKNYPHQNSAILKSRYLSGQFDYLIRNHSDRKDFLLKSLLKSGQIDKALKTFSDNPDTVKFILLHATDDHDKLRELYPDDTEIDRVLALYSNNYEDFLEKSKGLDNTYSQRHFDARLAIALKNEAQSNIDSIEHVANTATGNVLINGDHMFSTYFLVPVLRFLDGDTDALNTQQQRIQSQLKTLQGQRPWHCARLLAGTIGKQRFYEQPYQLFVDHDYHLFAGIQHDLRKRKKLALKHYQNVLSLPKHKRYFSAVQNVFLKQRIAALK